MALGLGVQVLGNSFIWDHHIRITRQAGDLWLGRPNRTGAAVPEREGMCGACFEDMHRQQWLPPFHPIHGHLWLLSHVARGHDWATALKDSPWSRYTTIPFDVAGTYGAVRLDWWFFELRAVSLPLAIVLLLLLTAGAALGLAAFAKAVGRRAAAGLKRQDARAPRPGAAMARRIGGGEEEVPDPVSGRAGFSGPLVPAASRGRAAPPRPGRRPRAGPRRGDAGPRPGRLAAGGITRYEKVWSLGLQGSLHHTWPWWSPFLPEAATYAGAELFGAYFAVRCSAGARWPVRGAATPTLVLGCGLGLP